MKYTDTWFHLHIPYMMEKLYNLQENISFYKVIWNTLVKMCKKFKTFLKLCFKTLCVL